MAKEKVCLAYSGGLDTSCILAWLIEKGYSVVCFMADVGQEEDFEAAKAKAKQIGAESIHVEDLRREFVEDLWYDLQNTEVNRKCVDCVASQFPCGAMQCNLGVPVSTISLLKPSESGEIAYTFSTGTSLARPVIAKAQMDVAKREGCVAVSHGCTGKGNDQVRFELAFYAIQPSIRVFAPWRLPEFYERFAGRNDLLDYASQVGIPVTSTKAKPWSMDENLAHCSYEAGILEDPDITPPSDMWKMTDDPLKAPDTPEDFTIKFEKGLPVSLHYTEKGSKKVATDSVDLFLALNQIGRRNGVGRIDIVENRYIGLKSRGCYDSPSMTILRLAHLDLEGLVLDREVRSLRDQWVTFEWSKILYNGLYYSPEREFVESSILASQKNVNGQVRCRVYKGSASVLGRSSDTENLYSASESSMDSLEDFSPVDTTGFIGIQAIRLKKYGQKKQSSGEAL